MKLFHKSLFFKNKRFNIEIDKLDTNKISNTIPILEQMII